MRRSALLALAALALGPAARAQQLPFTPPPADDSAAVARAMSALARDALARWRSDDRDAYLNTAFRLRAVAGDWAGALEAIDQLRALRTATDSVFAPAVYSQHEILIRARRRAEAEHVPFDSAFAPVFDDVFRRLDDRRAYAADGSFGANLAGFRSDFERALAARRGHDSIPLADAVDLGRRYFLFDAYRALRSRAPAALRAERARRYVIDDSVRIRTRDGATIAAMVVRPRRLAGRQPAVLAFTIYADAYNLPWAMESAAYGYVGVVANTRGKRIGGAPVEPFEHDGDDAYDVIDWIARQPWSDGRVAMHGGSYVGFTQWAAAAKLHPALRAIAPAVAVVPGFDTPTEHGIFQSFHYPWIPYVANLPLLDDTAYADQERWNRMDARWFASGAAYRTLDRIDGVPSPIFQRWIAHPAYDDYWRRMTAHGDQFARIAIPVLTITGYFDGAQVGAMHYYREHLAHRPGADEYLLIGPWEHFGAQARPAPVVGSWRVDPAALVDVTSVIYGWFDHVLKGRPLPALLADRVNFEVMGENAWRHAPSLAAMSDDTLTFYLDTARVGAYHALASRSGGGAVAQAVDLADRADTTNNAIHDPLADSTLDVHGGVAYVSAPLPRALVVSGSFLADLRLATNKRDLDLGVNLYQQMPDGRYFQLGYFVGRASWVRDPAHPRLLTSGAVEQVQASGPIIVKRVEAGSRLVVVVNVNKTPHAPLNYGTGGNVYDETIADARVPMRLRWMATSRVRVPVAPAQAPAAATP